MLRGPFISSKYLFHLYDPYVKVPPISAGDFHTATVLVLEEYVAILAPSLASRAAGKHPRAASQRYSQLSPDPHCAPNMVLLESQDWATVLSAVHCSEAWLGGRERCPPELPSISLLNCEVAT